MKMPRNILRRDIKQMNTRVIPDKRHEEMVRFANLEMNECVCGYEVTQRILEAYILNGYSEKEYEDDCTRMVGSSSIRSEKEVLEIRAQGTKGVYRGRRGTAY